MRKDREVLHYLAFSTPIGWILIAGSPDRVRLVEFAGDKEPTEEDQEKIVRREYPEAVPEPARDSLLLEAARAAVLKYLTEGVAAPAPPLDMGKGTPFQQEVWKAIARIPFGETRSYLEIAKDIGRPRSSRAVGQACGRNPLPLFVPCHRVTASRGKLGGFGGGLAIKKALLELERKAGDAARKDAPNKAPD